MKTHFSNPSWLNEIKTNDIDQLHDQLGYFMWETSTDTMSQVGVPSDEDVREWIVVLQSRPDVDDRRVQFCILDCEDYVNGTDLALKTMLEEKSDGV